MTTELLDPVFKKLDTIEASLKSQADKADLEIKAIGKVSTDTQTALDNIGIKQRELADELLQIKQRQSAPADEPKPELSWGEQFVKSAGYMDKIGALASNMKFGNIGFEVKNTLTGSDTNVAPARSNGVVSGAYQPLTLEAFLPSTHYIKCY